MKRPMQNWLNDTDALTHSTHNEGKSVVAGRFIRTLKSKIYKKWQLMIKTLVFVI